MKISLKLVAKSIALLVLLLTTSCVSGTKLTATWQGEDHRGSKIKSVLIIADTEKAVHRRMFEDGIADLLMKEGIETYSSFAIMAEHVKIKKETVKAVVQEMGINSVLLMRLIGIKKDEVYTPSIVWHEPNYYSSYYAGRFYPFGIAKPAVIEPGYFSTEKTVVIESSLFETVSGKLIWSVVSETLNPDSPNDLLDSMGAVIVKNMLSVK